MGDRSTLGSLAVKRGLVGGPFGSKLGKKDYVPTGVPVIRGQNLDRGRFVSLDDCVYVTPEKVKVDLAGNVAAPGDLVFTQRGTLGQVAIMPDGAPPSVISQSQMRLRVDGEVADPSYVYYWATSDDCLRQIGDRAIVSGVPHINLGILRELSVPALPLTEQRRIAGVLSAFDDLIDTNSKILRSLMEVAGAAFRRAVVESEETVFLSDLYGVGLSGVWGEDQPSQRSTVRTRVLRGRDLEDLITGVPLNPPTRYLSPNQVASRTPAVGEIWTAGSGSLGPTVPVTPDFARLVGNGEPVLYSNFVKRLVPTDEPSWYGLAWLALVHAWRQGRFSAFRTGTAMPNLDPSALLRGMEVPRLQKKARAELNEVVQAALGPELRQENRALASTRDELLPLLMSGRITVDEAWEAVP